jgi:hypothetical protein
MMLSDSYVGEAYETLNEFTQNQGNLSRQAKKLRLIKKSSSWKITVALRKFKDLLN